MSATPAAEPGNEDNGQLEVKRVLDPDEDPSDNEPESDVTDVGYDSETEFEVGELLFVIELMGDAIKWAKWKDSRMERTDGFVGWHYGVMWKGYLKTLSETEEPLDSFETDDDDHNPFIDLFWEFSKRPIPRGRKEPPRSKKGASDLVEASPELLKIWFKNAKPRRDYETYRRRRAKELAGLPILKSDSDYYWRKKRKARNAARRAAGSEVRGTSAGTSVTSRREEDAKAMPPPPLKGKDESTPPPSPTESFNSLFDESSQPSLSQGTRPSPSPVATGKRRRVIASPEPSPSTKEKKKKKKETSKLLSNIKISKRTEPLPAVQTSTANSSTEKPSPGGWLTQGPSVPEPLEASASTSQVAVDQHSTPAVAKQDVRRTRSKSPQPSAPTAGQSTSMLPPNGITAELNVPGSRLTFGAPDPSIFGGATNAQRATSVASSAPSPQASTVPRRQQEPLFDFGESPSQPEVQTSVQEVPADSPSPGKVEEELGPSLPIDNDDDIIAIDPPLSQPSQVILVEDSPGRTTEVQTAVPEAATEPKSSPTVAVSQNEASARPAVPEATTTESPFAPGSDMDIESDYQGSQAEAPSSTPVLPALTVTSATPMRGTASPSTVSPQSKTAYDASLPSSPLRKTMIPTNAGLPPRPLQASLESGEIMSAATSATPSAQAKGASEGPGIAAQAVAAPSTHPPVRIPIPLAKRPKYEQPKRIKTIDLPADPARVPSVRRLSGGTHSMSATLKSPTSATTPLPPVPEPSAYVPLEHPLPNRALPGVSSNELVGKPVRPPPQQNLWKQKRQPFPPTGPRSAKITGANATAVGGVSPYGNISPYNGGKSPIAPTGPRGNKSPNAPYGNGVGGNKSPVAPGNISPYGHQSPYGNVSPHMGGMSPQLGNKSPLAPQQPIPPAAPATYQVARDPRLKRRPSPSAVQAAAPPPRLPAAPPASVAPIQPVPSGQLLRHFQFHLSERSSNIVKAQVALRAGHSKSGEYLVSSPMFAESLLFEEADNRCVDMLLATSGEVVEWTQAAVPAQDEQRTWQRKRESMTKSHKVYVCTDEAPTGVPITSHNIVILAIARDAHISSMLNGQDPERVGVVVIVVSVPIMGKTLPILPNPVRPDFFTGDEEQHAPPRSLNAPTLVSSYVDSRTLQMFANKTAWIMPPMYNQTALYKSLLLELKKADIRPPTPDMAAPNAIFVLNGNFDAVVGSGTMQRSLERNTKIYACGHDLHVPVVHWPLKPIWERGGLVTFSPTFILRAPDKFADIMDIIRSTPHWAAYIIPPTVLWFAESWQHKGRCTEPSKAYGTLTSALFMDDNLRRLSGSAAADAGGLAVSCAPPQLQNRDKSLLWLDWIRKVFQVDEFAHLVKLCEERVRSSRRGTPSRDAGRDEARDEPLEELSLASIEEEGIKDLAAMRLHPHSVPSRRFLYIGHLSLKEDVRKSIGGSVELIKDADDFIAVLSGAI